MLENKLLAWNKTNFCLKSLPPTLCCYSSYKASQSLVSPGAHEEPTKRTKASGQLEFSMYSSLCRNTKTVFLTGAHQWEVLWVQDRIKKGYLTEIWSDEEALCSSSTGRHRRNGNSSLGTERGMCLQALFMCICVALP